MALLTCLAFAWAVLWPDVARARDAAPPPPPAATDDASLAAAKQHFEAGKAAYNAGDFPGSIREFKAAEALRPSPVLAYNIGLANEKLGRRRVAVRYYKRFLEGSPNAPNKAEVEGRITSLEQAIAAQPQAGVQEQPTDNPPPPAGGQAMQADPNGPPPPMYQQGADPYAGQPITTQPPRKKRNLWWVWLIVGLGAAAVVTAIVVVAVLYTRDTDNTVYYDKTVVQPLTNRAALFDRSSVAPPSRAAETAPLVNIRF